MTAPDPHISAGLAAARRAFEGRPAVTPPRFCILRHPDGTHTSAEIEDLMMPCSDEIIAIAYEAADAATIAAALNAARPVENQHLRALLIVPPDVARRHREEFVAYLIEHVDREQGDD